MELIKTSKNTLEPSGSISYWSERIKYKTIDGETYEKCWREDVTKTWDEIKKERPHRIVKDEHYFDLADFSFTVFDSDFLSSGTVLRNKFSESPYVNRLLNAERSGIFEGSEVLNVFTDKSHLGLRGGFVGNELWKYTLKTQQIDIDYYSYGWSNSVFYTVSVKKLFDTDFEKIPYVIVNFFKKNGINLKSNKRDEESIKFLNQSLTILNK